MPLLNWDIGNETFEEFCRRQDRARVEALRSEPTFRYERTPYLNVSYSCSGDDCGTDSIVLDTDHDYTLVCTTCKTRWQASEAYDGVDGEPIQDQGELSAEALAALPVKEW